MRAIVSGLAVASSELKIGSSLDSVKATHISMRPDAAKSPPPPASRSSKSGRRICCTSPKVAKSKCSPSMYDAPPQSEPEKERDEDDDEAYQEDRYSADEALCRFLHGVCLG